MNLEEAVGKSYEWFTLWPDGRVTRPGHGYMGGWESLTVPWEGDRTAERLGVLASTFGAVRWRRWVGWRGDLLVTIVHPK